MGLEKVLKEFGRGTVTGLANVLDPVGKIVSDTDYWVTGVGPADKERALETFSNEVYKKVYPDSDEDVDFNQGYVPRVAGYLAGGAAGIGGLIGLACLTNPITALAVPATFGVYSLGSSIFRYFHDFRDGEKINGSNEKATFMDGFKFGYHKGSHLIQPVHGIESELTGRGLCNSHVKSSVQESSKKARRNFSSIFGGFLGGIVGGIVSVASFMIVPVYKLVRDVGGNFEKTNGEVIAEAE